MSKYFAIKDKDPGFIQYVTPAEDEQGALQAFDYDVGIDPLDEGLNTDDWTIVELTKEQYDRLKDCWPLTIWKAINA